MGTLPIFQKNHNQRACPGNENLPANYMSDYSVLGLMVGRLDTALRVLKEKQFEVQKKTDKIQIYEGEDVKEDIWPDSPRPPKPSTLNPEPEP